LSAADGAELPQWSPRAHIDLELVPGLVRQYSLCGLRADHRTWTIAVLREPDGRGGSRHIHDTLTEHSDDRVLGLRNLFELQPATRYIFIAGGIGITPIVPMTDAAEHSGIPWELHYGGGSLRSMAYIDDLRSAYGDKVALCPEDDQGVLNLTTILSRPEPGTLVCCCGPPGLIGAVEQRCGVWPAESLHFERFFTAGVLQGDAEVDVPFDVILNHSGVRATVPGDKTILEVLRDEYGVDIVSGCERGICGTCETAVIDGIPDHRDSVLSAEERTLNQTMMVCVSRSKSKVITLDP
jgi:ferredoxin-NADP reductase